MPISSTDENKKIMNFIDDYTMMCWVYLLKPKSQAFKNLKSVHLWIENEVQSNIETLPQFLILIKEESILLMNLKTIFTNLGSSIKPLLHKLLNRIVYLKE
jgi:hypothetical protein